MLILHGKRSPTRSRPFTVGSNPNRDRVNHTELADLVPNPAEWLAITYSVFIQLAAIHFDLA